MSYTGEAGTISSFYLRFGSSSLDCTLYNVLTTIVISIGVALTDALDELIKYVLIVATNQGLIITWFDYSTYY